MGAGRLNGDPERRGRLLEQSGLSGAQPKGLKLLLFFDSPVGISFTLLDKAGPSTMGQVGNNDPIPQLATEWLVCRTLC